MFMKKLIVIIFSLLLAFTCTSSLAWGESNADRYEKAISLLSEFKYAEAAQAFAELGDYNDALRYAMYCSAIAAGEAGNYSIAVENLTTLNGFMSSNMAAIYYTALSHESMEEYEQAADLLRGLAFYRDVTTRLSEYPDKINGRDYRRAETDEQNGRLEEALAGFKKLGTYSDSSDRAASVQEKIYARDYAKAEEYEQSNQLENALNGFKVLGTYRDSAERVEAVQEKINARDYAAADQAEKDEDYAAAYTGFMALGQYKDSAARAQAVQNKGNYAIAMENAKKGNYKEAYEGFTSLGDFEDSKDKAYVLSVVNFASLKRLNEYIAAFQMHDLWGIMDFEKNVVTSPYWDDIGAFNEDELAMVSLDKKYGYINRAGKVVIECEWDDISEFRNGLVTVGTEKKNGTLFGLYDKEGNCVTEVVWQTLGSSQNNYWGASVTAPVFSGDKIRVQDENGFWGFLDTKGKTVGSITWNEIGDFSEGLATVKKEDLYGYINSNGEVIIDPQYTDAHAFHEGLAAVKINGNYQYINKDNQVIIQPSFVYATDFSGGRADVYRAGTGWQVIDLSGHLEYFMDPEMQAAYEKAESLMADGHYLEAYDIYKTLNGYKDVDSLLKTDENLIAAEEEARLQSWKTVGSCVTFGTYPQTKAGTDATPIEWLVLDVQENKALLISRYALDCQPYYTKYKGITWEKCTLRTWLNSEFIYKAFSADEQEAILMTEVDNSNSQGYGAWDTIGGNNTQDKIFLLSYAEAWKYFADDASRKCAPTEYAVAQGGYTSSSDFVDGKATGLWWLRSPGGYQNYAARVRDDGSRNHLNVNFTHAVVRPAFWINLESDIF